MERIYTLIDKLYQQKNLSAPPSQLLFTVQLLQQELYQLQDQKVAGSAKKVALTLPFHFNFSATIPTDSFVTASQPATEEKEIFILDVIEEEQEEAPATVTAPSQESYSIRKPVIQESLFEEPVVPAREEPKQVYRPQPLFNAAFEAVTEAPTLTQYQNRLDLHETIAEKKESLNDTLKQDKAEVAHAIKDAPIKDLRKGIGINERFVFVRELFRGDDAMYERSIKTINGFNIFSEAEYWINRELKFKLGWADNQETVKEFYRLVRRRFS